MDKRSTAITTLLTLALCLAAAPAFAGQNETAVTMWGVFFNEPQNCTDGVCDEDDVFVDPVAPQTAVTYLAGTRIQANGGYSIGAAYEEGQTYGSLPFPANTVWDVDAAEIHLVIRSHGTFVPGVGDEQVTTFGEGCMDECVDVQFAVFRPADAGPDGVQSVPVMRFADLRAVPGSWATITRDGNGFRVALHSRM